MNKHIVLLPGDGIGPEVVAQGVNVLRAVEKRFGVTFTTEEALMGGAAIDATGGPLPAATVAACKKADAVLLGAVGGPKWDKLPPRAAHRNPAPGAPPPRARASPCARHASSTTGSPTPPHRR